MNFTYLVKGKSQDLYSNCILAVEIVRVISTLFPQYFFFGGGFDIFLDLWRSWRAGPGYRGVSSQVADHPGPCRFCHGLSRCRIRTCIAIRCATFEPPHLLEPPPHPFFPQKKMEKIGKEMHAKQCICTYSM